MPALAHLRTVLWTLVAVAALGATGLYAYTTFIAPRPAAGLGQADYDLVTAAGEPFTRASLSGHPSMLFFGFTHCPDVCPTSLAEMTAWYETLGDEARDLQAYFVTVDPERDTPEIIGDYVSWTGRVTGVTGSPEEIDRMARSWAVYYEKVPLEGDDYTMDHTASVFLVDRDGNFQGTIAYRESSDTAVAKLRRLISG
ncbi:protein SCO1/2 [Devosia lucknowensis]|uniref:Protein SCO1/2 n=1 Tax=Devosia lucknowensis TaxID=1096929 RepID=A0A1Y6G6B6_9HYPH|nr:SCO family protein [Devosia lucknowensis]SMQ85626.1 protein SCO1/2 [Devosia lucknowensis]